MKTVFNFLKELCVNNNREWFDAHRDQYKSAKLEMEQVVDGVIQKIAEWDVSIADLNAKSTMFRIFRDTRFSLDKTPYKTNMGGYIVPGGRNCAKSGYYLHIEPDNSFVAGGIYMPPSPELLKIRTAIFEDPKPFLSIITDNDFKSNFELFSDDKLKTAPKGFPRDFEHIDLLRNKHFAMSHKLSDELVVSDNLIPYVLEKFKLMYPLNSYINTILQ